MEDIKKRELGLANHKKIQLENQKEVLDTTFKENLIDSKQSTENAVKLDRLKQNNVYRKYLMKQINHKMNEIKEAENKVQEKREELTEAIKQRKILENLKALRLEQYIQEEKKREQNLTDEIVSYQYTKKEKGD